MTRSSHPVRAHILDFDDDFQRTLRRKRKQPELNPSSSSFEPEFKAETDLEEEQDMAVFNRTIKELSASRLDNAVPLCIQYPGAAEGKTDEFELLLKDPMCKVQPLVACALCMDTPLLDTIKQVPRYAKFLKELCTTRRRISNKEVVRVSENVSAVLQRKLPPKCKDPADFYVLEMEDSAHSTPLPILLGRPFMKTARTKIDVSKRTLTMKFDGDIIDFNISEAIRYPIDDHLCFSIDAFDSLAQEYLESLDRDALETTIVQGIKLITNGAEPNHEEIGEMVAALESLPQYVGYLPTQ
ncbi:hypothetical protein L3X38_033158 [Prunus dulcis]|uniref:Reverse transcriptase domain-containing protein n=1 Tax=Prunus dulcis TaxID=3755 RepID=A0AAD4YWL6_PRUDU|nr:hypothetical protein L3X38_033158 [Prunus dulcis]